MNRLSPSEESFRLLVEGVKDHAFFLLDPDGLVSSWNVGAESLKGYRADEILGRHFSCFYPPEDIARGKPQAELQTARKQGRMEDEGWRLKKDGSLFWANVVITTLVDRQGGILGFSKITRDLTERKRAEDNARLLREEHLARTQAEAAEQSYRTMGDSIPQILWIAGADGKLEYFNRRWFEYTALSTEHPFAGVWASVIHPDDYPACVARWRQCQLRGEPWEVEYRIRRADGAYLWHLGRSHPLLGAGGKILKWFGTATDIDAQKRIEAEHLLLLEREKEARIRAEASQQQLRFLAEASMQFSSSLDYEGTLASVAQLAVPMLADWCAVDVVDPDGKVRSLTVAHVDPERGKWAQALKQQYPPDLNGSSGVARALRAGQAVFFPEIPDAMLVQAAMDAEHLRLMRQIGFTSAIIAPLLAHGKTLGVLTLVSAESGRRYRQEDVALAEQLALRAALAMDNARLYSEAQEAIEIRDNFVAIATHELKTPLTAIYLQIDGIQRLVHRLFREPDKKLVARIETAVKHTARLERLINDLLDVSRMTAGRLRLELEDVDAVEVTQDVVSRFKDEFARTGCPVSVGEHDPIIGHWDRMRLDQIVTNLVANAIKYGAGQPIDVSLASDGQRARIAVRDHGIGIDPSHQARIFERFERAVSNRHYGGFGIGLWIVKQLTEAMGGEVAIESELGAGSTFTIELPQRPTKSA